MLDGQLAAQIQVRVTSHREARALLARVPVLRTLLTPLLAQLAAVEQHHRLAEQARAATVVSGSTQLLLTTTLTPQQLGDVLLDIVARATQNQAGLILYNAAVLGQQGIQLLAAHALDPILLQALVATTSVRAYTFPMQASVRALQSVPSRGDVPSAALLREWGFRTSLEVPIVLDARPIGSIILLRQQEEFREHHVRLCEMHASRLTLALRHHIAHETVLHDYQDTLRVMVASYESSAPHLHGHASRIARLAVDLADLLGLSADEMEGLRLAAELHDVGMAGVCEKLLLQPGRLPGPKYHAIRHHPIVGAALTAPIRRPIPIAPLILHHHERYDGGGYPDGLHGTMIPLGARILALGEVVDAMLTPRSYRQALPFAEAMAKVKDASGTQLDPLVVAAFENLVRQGRHALYGWDRRC
jgi:HD-GYP domain-containing protein (c-di-GMP phosphodiesterase class II)